MGRNSETYNRTPGNPPVWRSSRTTNDVNNALAMDRTPRGTFAQNSYAVPTDSLPRSPFAQNGNAVTRDRTSRGSFPQNNNLQNNGRPDSSFTSMSNVGDIRARTNDDFEGNAQWDARAG